MTGFNGGTNRTAIGLAVNLPQFRYNDTYQFQNNLTYVRGNHLIKAGFDVRSQYVKSFFFPTIRGLLRYATLDTFVDDVAEAANINKPLPGGEEVNYYRWWDQYYYVQDEWRVRPSFTLNFGLRYELPGNNIQSLIDLNERILAANGNNPVFRARRRCRRPTGTTSSRASASTGRRTPSAAAWSAGSPAATSSSCAAATRARTTTRSSTSR